MERATPMAMVPRGDLATEQELSDALHDIPQVKASSPYVDTVGAEIPMEYLDEDTPSQLVSENYSRFVITVDADYEGEETFELVENIRNTVNTYYPDSYYLAGSGVSTYDLMDTITADTVKVNLIAIGAVFLVLLLTMKSISLPVILVLAVETAVWINVAIPYFQGNTVFYISYLIISSIQLGATVDYAIYSPNGIRNLEPDVQKTGGSGDGSDGNAIRYDLWYRAGGGRLLLGYVSSHGILSQLGFFLESAASCPFSSFCFVLPGLLYLLDGVIQHTTLNLHFYKVSRE